MSVFAVYVVSASGSLQYFYEHSMPFTDVEKTFDFPVPLRFKLHDGKLIVDFGSYEDVKIGHAILSVNSLDSKGTQLADGKDILQVLADKSNFPLTIKFGRPRQRPNDRIQLASMFQPLHQMARHLSPVPDPAKDSNEKRVGGVFNSGIQTLDTPTCRMHCLEPRTGVKFLMVTDSKLPSAARESLNRVYEAYTDFVLKNPFYAHNQPFNFELFTQQVKTICEQVERGIYGAP
ncbi:unnamed protein product [Dicrocoelium dendriticum]|nr:unnamed protein product [Dicrocoelium dendriticum]